MKKIYCLPEKDFETYVLPFEALSGFPGTVPKKTLRLQTRQDLERLHPGFGPSHEVDIKVIRLGEARWRVVTVMTAELLAEHRALAGNSLLAGTERLFFDREGLPLAEEKSETKSDASICELRGKNLYVFRRPSRMPLAAAAVLGLCLAAFGMTGSLRLASGFVDAPGAVIPEQPHIEGETPMTETLAPLPDALALLRLLTYPVTESGGSLSHLEITMGYQPGIELSVNGADPASVLSALDKTGFLEQGSFGEVLFAEGQPAFPVRYQLDTNRPLRLTEAPDMGDAARSFPALQALITVARGRFENYRLVSDEAGPLISLEFAISPEHTPSLLRSLETGLPHLGMEAVTLQVEADRAGSFLRIALGLRKTGINPEPDIAAAGIAGSFERVPRAFGFSSGSHTAGRTAASKVKDRMPARDWEKLGSIKSGSGRTIVYWRDREGKIHGLAD